MAEWSANPLYEFIRGLRLVCLLIFWRRRRGATIEDEAVLEEKEEEERSGSISGRGAKAT